MKWLASEIIEASIRRAARRGRITKLQAKQLCASWRTHAESHPISTKMHIHAIYMLNQASIARLEGDYRLARVSQRAASDSITRKI